VHLLPERRTSPQPGPPVAAAKIMALNRGRQHDMPIVNGVFIILVLMFIEEIRPAGLVENVT
jgi:hypothetical protein